MSRSYKKHPVVKDGGRSHKEAKQMANRRFRRCADADDCTSSRAGYKRFSESWDICDFVHRVSGIVRK